VEACEKGFFQLPRKGDAMTTPEAGPSYLVPPRAHAQEALQRLLGRFETDQPDTFAHGAAVEALSVDAAKRLHVREPLLGALRLGAFLHDIGKLEVPRRILRKPGPLTTREWVRIRRHPVAGVRLLSPIIRSEETLAIVRYHHERWDGTGYPHGLAGNEIPLPARVVAVTDAFYAMSEARSYQPPLLPEEALLELQGNAGGQFDPVCVEAVCEAVAVSRGSHEV
jgi:putative nucleotidyltransferase with HDIG domain